MAQKPTADGGADELTEDQWRRVQQDIREHLDAYRGAYESGQSRRMNKRYEDDRVIVFSDGVGQELNEIAAALDVNRGHLSRRMHEEARRVYSDDLPGDPWEVADPIVVYKEDNDD